MDEQLHWCWKFQAFHSLSCLHMVVQCDGAHITRLELFLLRIRRVYIHGFIDTIGSHHYISEQWLIAVYKQYDYECHIWDHYWRWNN